MCGSLKKNGRVGKMLWAYVSWVLNALLGFGILYQQLFVIWPTVHRLTYEPPLRNSTVATALIHIGDPPAVSGIWTLIVTAWALITWPYRTTVRILDTVIWVWNIVRWMLSIVGAGSLVWIVVFRGGRNRTIVRWVVVHMVFELFALVDTVSGGCRLWVGRG